MSLYKRLRPIIKKIRFIKLSILWFYTKFFLKYKLSYQLNTEKLGLTSKNLVGHRVFVPLIETSHYQHHHILILAKILQLRGADVRVLICDQFLDGCEIKSEKNKTDKNPCWNCKLNQDHLLNKYDLKIIKMSKLADKIKLTDIEISEDLDMRLNNAVNSSVVRYYYGNVPKDKNQSSSVRNAHYKSAVLAHRIAKFIDEEFNPTSVIGNMIGYSAWEPIYNHFNDNGNRFRKIHMSPFDFKCITIDIHKLYEPMRFNQYITGRTHKNLLDSEKVELNRFMDLRYSGQADTFTRYSYFKDKPESNNYNKIQINPNKKNIFLFSNVYWDVGPHNKKIFDGVIDWVLETIEELKKNNEIHLYIKPHPGEVLDDANSLKGISDFIKEKYPHLPKNVTIIEPEQKLNTYKLFKYIDLGIVYSGTLGLEMLLNDIPTINVGLTPYQGLDIGIEPQSISEYFDILNASRLPTNGRKSKIELFGYFYFIKTKIPWTLTKTAWGDDFSGFLFPRLEDTKLGNDPILDHICDCLTDDKTIIENWPDQNLGVIKN